MPTDDDTGAKRGAAASRAATETASDSPWKRRARKLLFAAILLQLAGMLAFFVAVLAGEATRPTMLVLYAPRQPLLIVALAGALLAPLTRVRRVRALLAVQMVVCVLVLFPVMGMKIGFSRNGDHVVRLASYNVYFGKLGRPKLLDELVSMVNERNLDILLIQAPWESMGARMKERFPDRTVHEFDDFIVVTRLPIRRVFSPTRLDDGTSAKFVNYLIDTSGGPVGIYNVHPFSPRHALFGGEAMESNVEHRTAQLAAAVGAAHADGPPFLIVGDTNVPGLSALGRKYFEGLHDAFDDVGFGFGYTFPSKRPWMRIDRALASDGVRFLAVDVGPPGASDHRPLFVDFEVANER